MGLGSYQIRRRPVDLPGGDSFSVRGLSLSDISELVESFRPELERVFDLVQSEADIQLEDAANLAYSLIHSFPSLVSYAIALSSGEVGTAKPGNNTADTWSLPDLAAKVIDMPAGVQAQALMEIGTLTFEDQSPKKVVEAVIRAIEGGRTMIDEFSAPKTATPQG